MDSIRIGASVKRIAINDDPERVIVFDPSDVAFVERFQGLTQELVARQAEYEQRARELDQVTEADELGLPVNLDDRLGFMREVCEYTHGQIDALFGAGTSRKAFEGALSLEMIGEFFEGLTPFIQNGRSEKLAKYLPQPTPAKKKARRRPAAKEKKDHA